MSVFLTRETILNSNDLNRELVEIPEWGGHVYVQPMTASARDSYEMSFIDKNEDGTKKSPENIRAKIAVACACDQEGNPVFSQHDVYWLGQKNSSAVDRIFSVARRINALTNEDIEDAKKN